MKKMLQVSVALAALVVLVGLAIACYRPRLVATTCPHTTPMTFTIPLVVTGPQTVTWPSAYPQMCPSDIAVWTLESQCSTCGKVKVRIDDRVRKHATSCAQAANIAENKDCFKKDSSNKTCKPEHAGVLYGDPPAKIGECTVDAQTENGCYKYSLKGDVDVDPEVEVQGGLGMDRGPVTQASPSH